MDLKINNKFVAFKGCIGRREYFLNNIYLGIINSFLTLPLSFWMVSSSQTFLDLFDFKALLSNSPIFATFFYVLSCVISLVIGFGFLVRRFADIWGVQENIRIYLFALVIAVIPYLWLFFTNPLTALLLIVDIILCLILLFTPGKISSQLPVDEVKAFNWGAFWGTWIWGLFNKVYVTLFAIPLYFTPAGFLFSLVCGLKGNEWAYKKAGVVDIKTFHKGQKNQAIVWNILAGFTIIVLPILLSFLLIAFMVTAAIKNPDSLNSFVNKTESFMEMIIEEEFDEYELDLDENRFYVDPQDWVDMSFEERYNLFKGASTFAALKKKQSEEFKNYSGTRATEMSITKIYSSYNGEVLAEFTLDDKEIKDFKSALKQIMKSVKFNPNPELPPPLPKVD